MKTMARLLRMVGLASAPRPLMALPSPGINSVTEEIKWPIARAIHPSVMSRLRQQALTSLASLAPAEREARLEQTLRLLARQWSDSLQAPEGACHQGTSATSSATSLPCNSPPTLAPPIP